MAKLTTAEFIDAIKELSVLELNDLVKACEEEFGVSAAAGVVVAAAGADGAGAAEEKDEFDVELVSAGSSKVKVIKVVREIDVYKRQLLVSSCSRDPLPPAKIIANILLCFIVSPLFLTR